ncbi:MAG: sensor domain-containing diguanylate cyclase, partial [candidate division Zixibacteria bacterium]
LVMLSGGFFSSMYLMFFLTISISAYILTFYVATAVVAIATASYIALLFPSISLDNAFDVSLRLGFFWVYFLAISYASQYMRKSERRLIKLFDTLNRRTSELEKSQVQLEMIYENSRTLASLLDQDGIVKELISIMSKTLRYPQCAVVEQDKWGRCYYRARCKGQHLNLRLKAIGESSAELLLRILSGTEAIRINTDTRDDYEPLDESSRSALIVPMAAHGKNRGLLIAESPSKDFFTDRDTQQLSSVARAAAMALENADLHKRTEELTMTDELTGAYNYRYFVHVLEEEKKRALRYDLPLSVIMVDIDWFKNINDSYGHEVGNMVLKRLSLEIKRCIRDVDIFARYGGEEFAVVLPQTPQIEAKTLGERIRSQVEQMVVKTEQHGSLRITVSVGISSYPENGKSHDELVSVADQALYRAKGSGKNLVCTI